MNEKRNFDYKRLHPFKWYILENFPFLEDSIDVLTNYQLFCKLGEMYNKEVNAINTLGTQVEGITDWFDNLDVQDEVNNKLDEMAESGELEEIIAAYINTNALICFDNVEDMQEAENLVAGSYAKTLGYYAINDGGQGIYKIRTIKNDDVVDNGSIIALNDNNLVAELIILNNTINVKQFGAKGDGVSDDTIPIQKAIDFYHVGNDSENQNYFDVLLVNYPNAGGTILFPKAVYNISSTIKVPCYVDLDFDYSTIKAITGGTFISNYMFAINSYNLSAWTYSYVSRKGFIRNGYFNGNNIENIRGFYILDAHKISNLEFYKMYNAINYAGGYYVDGIFIDHCIFNYCYGDEPQIKKRCQGEALQITNCEFEVNTPNNTACNGMEIFGGTNGTIRNIINGKIKIYNAQDYTITNWHCERGNFTSQEIDNVIIKDSYLYVRDNSSPITLLNGSSNNNLRSIFLENVKFVYYLQKEQYNYDTKDIDLSAYVGHIFIKGCYRELWTESRTSIVQTGIALYNGTSYLLNPFNECEVYNKKILPKNSTTRRDEYVLNSAATDSHVNWNLPTGTYYYKVINFCDIPKLCGFLTGEKSVSVTSAENGVKLAFGGDLGQGNIIRIYRGTTSGSYNSYVDVPNVKNINLFDNGYSVNGYKWIADSTAIPTLNSIQTLERSNNFVSTLVVGKGYAAPTTGTWSQADRIERLNPSAGGNIGWICTTAGTPGTWKSYGTIQS